MFIDETWIKTNMAPIRGWGMKGKRLRGYAPHGHWRTLTFVAAPFYIKSARTAFQANPRSARSAVACAW